MQNLMGKSKYYFRVGRLKDFDTEESRPLYVITTIVIHGTWRFRAKLVLMLLIQLTTNYFNI